jgi:glycosyltransferase involved in cell wall biosynthesis
LDDSALRSELTAQRFVTVLHYYATGAGQELHAWLRALRVTETTLIEHPFAFSKRTHTRIERVRNEAINVVERRRFRGPAVVRYTLDLVRTIAVVRRFTVVYDFYIGNGAFDTLAGIALRWMGRVRHVVLYTIDYAPAAGGSRWYARIYRLIDRYCCRHADVIWNLSTRMQAARVADGLDPECSAPVLHVPHGTHAAVPRDAAPEAVPGLRAGFMGHVQEKSGVQLFVEALPALRSQFPGLGLDVFGDGPYVPDLRALVARLDLSDAVAFHGFIDDHAELEQRLSRCTFGLALYSPELDDFSRYADPGKPKVYLACGLPVIIVDVPAVAGEIAEAGAGLCISYDRGALSDAVATLIDDLDAFRANARAMAAQYDWQEVFARTWRNTLTVVGD